MQFTCLVGLSSVVSDVMSVGDVLKQVRSSLVPMSGYRLLYKLFALVWKACQPFGRHLEARVTHF